MSNPAPDTPAVDTPGYWEDRYLTGDFPWDLGHPSGPLLHYMRQLADKRLRILIPGGGAGHELAWLHHHGFANAVMLDFAPYAVQRVRSQYPQVPEHAVIEGDFFAHQGQYDLVLEQTFYCAIDPARRDGYMQHMATLVRPGGTLAGVWFAFKFDPAVGPPYGGSPLEYHQRMSPWFRLTRLVNPCPDSEPARAGKEVWLEAVRL